MYKLIWKNGYGHIQFVNIYSSEVDDIDIPNKLNAEKCLIYSIKWMICLNIYMNKKMIFKVINLKNITEILFYPGFFSSGRAKNFSPGGGALPLNKTLVQNVFIEHLSYNISSTYRKQIINCSLTETRIYGLEKISKLMKRKSNNRLLCKFI